MCCGIDVDQKLLGEATKFNEEAPGVSSEDRDSLTALNLLIHLTKVPAVGPSQPLGKAAI